MLVTISFDRLYITLLSIQEVSNNFMVKSGLFDYEI